MSKSVTLEIGSIYKKVNSNSYYFRYQINGERKTISLRTKNKKEAVNKAQEMIPILKADSKEVIAAHVQHAKSLVKKQKQLELSNAWEIYSNHPNRATPSTKNEQLAYEASFNEFVKFVKNNTIGLHEITQEMTTQFANYMRTTELAVHTHNRKLRRIKKVFEVLKEYYTEENPFNAKSLNRKAREEQDNSIRRLSFTRDEEKELLEVLENEKYIVMNKPEIKVIYHLGMFTGQRFKDCILLRWDRVNLDKKRIWVKQYKTGKEVTIPIAPKLMDVLLEAKEWKTNQYVCPNVAERYNKVDKNGKNTGNNLVNIDALRVIKWIGLEPSVKVEGRKKKVTVYGFHSLRHSFASHCAEAGIPKAVLLSILGTNSDIVDKYYTHIGDEAQEKAINAINGHFDSNYISDQDKIKEALDFIKANKKANPILETIEEILLK